MKFLAKTCRCGLDLSTVDPEQITIRENEDSYSPCPNCGRTYSVVEEEEADISEPETEPIAVSETDPENEAESEDE
jgi:hypothetical protein